MKAKKTWREKLLQSKDLPKIEVIDERMSQRWGTGTFVIPAPIEVDEIMRQIPEGKVITIAEIRAALAQNHQVNIGCPLTTGIFAWIAAHAAEEAAFAGKSNYTPYWRTLKSGGELNEKFPGGIDNLKMRLEMEGHEIIQKGKKYFVQNYQDALYKI
ncbi:MGMT family protein [candidate division KSB1 bacterium]|nr:MGMT family protein [candidate division KSB1 bacterium]